MHPRLLQETRLPLAHDFLFVHMLNGAAHESVSTAMMVPKAGLYLGLMIS